MIEPAKPTSKERAAVLLKAAFMALQEAGGAMSLRELKGAIARTVALTPHDLQVYEKTGYVRWESVLHFYSIDCVKAGFIRKHGGQWLLTPEGSAISSLSGQEILERAMKAYRQWRAARPEGQAPSEKPAEPADSSVERAFVFERAESEARSEIEAYVKALWPYDFQELVAAMLRGMGYYTPFVAPAGPDGGTDILAYPDAIGAKTPHVRVQVKHRAAQKATRDEIAALRGIIRHDREIGMFVSSAGFTSEAVREARQAGIHIGLMDLNGLLEQWLAHYQRLSEEDKGCLRLRSVYFLAPE